MAVVLANIVRVYTATTGTGTITLGSAVPTFLTFAQGGILNGQTVSYAIEDTNDREVGTGVYTSSGTTLTRSVITSTNSNAAISLSGSAQVFITAVAPYIPQLDAANTWTALQTFSAGISLGTPLAVTSGGTGLSSLTQGDLLYASASNTLAALAKSASATRYLSNTGASNAPAWAQVNLANGVTGNLPVTNLNSGTSASSSTFWRGDGTWSTPPGTAVGGADTNVQYNNAGALGGSANLTWVSPALTIGVAGSATGQLKLTGSTSGTITIQGQAAAGTYNFNLPTSAGTSGYPLLSGGGGATAMSFAQLNLASAVTGNLPVTNLNSGTSATSSTFWRGDGTWAVPPGQTVGGSDTQVQYNNAGSFGGSANLTWVSPALTIGAAGSTTGQLKLTGATSGTITVQGQAAAGTYNFNLPTTSGSSGDLLTSGGGTTNPMTWTTPGNVTKTDDTNVTLTLGGTPTGAAIKAFSLTLGWTGQLGVTRGGTGLSAVAQGDILYGSAANTLSALAKDANATRYLSNTGASNNPAWAQVNLANGVTGNLPVTNLNSGTSASNTTFWRGDGTWASPGGSGAPGGSTTQIQYNDVGSFNGSANLTWVSPALTIGVAGSATGQLKLTGSTSGTITIQGQAAAGTYNFNLPTAAGTSGYPLLSGGGGATAMSFGQLDLASAVTGNLPVTNLNSGTSASSSTYWRGDGTWANITASGAGGSDTQVQYNSGGVLAGSANLIWVSPALTIGAAGSTTGQLKLTGSTSGTITIQGQAAAGTYNFNLPTASGSSGGLLTSGGGTTNPMTWTTPGDVTKTDDTNVTLALGGTPTGAAVKAFSLTLGWTGTLAVGRGGTGLSTLAQGDILYASAANTLSALAKSASATRYLSNTGTTNNPAWAQVDLSNGVTGNLPVANLNSGTSASSSTFWRGDGTWASPSGFGDANTALSNLAAVAINTTLLPGSNDGAALGSATFSFSDLFLATGGVINWNNGTFTATQSSTNLAFSGSITSAANGTIQFGGSAASGLFSDGINVAIRSFSGTSGIYFQNASGVSTMGVATSNNWQFNVVAIPSSNDGAALGNTTNQWSDLFLASGGVINWNNGNVTITHSAAQLDMVGTANVFSQRQGTFVGYDTGINPVAEAAYNGRILTARAGTNTGQHWNLTRSGSYVWSVGYEYNTSHFAIGLAQGTDSSFTGSAIKLKIDGSTFAVTPGASGGAPLGNATLPWSDLFLKSGGVINWNNGNVTITHSAGALTANGSWVATSLEATSGDLLLSRTSSAVGYIVRPNSIGFKQLALAVVGGGNLTNLTGYADATAFTGTLAIGTAGSVVGDVVQYNATSGSITLRPVTGALGSSVLTLPAATDTIAVLAASQAFTNKTYNGLTITSSTGTLTVTNGKTLSISNTLTLAGTDSTTMTFPALSSNVLTTGNNATITVGYNVSPKLIGTVSSGTTTLVVSDGNYQMLINGGAFSLSPPAATNFDAIDLLVINGPSAGAITFTAGKWRVGASTGSTFATTVRATATITVTIASPGVVSWTAHGCVEGDPVWFTTSGALPTGITASTVYYVKYVDANSFQLATTPGGSAINTSGSQSGTHTGNAASQFILSVRQIYGSVTYSWYALQ